MLSDMKNFPKLTPSVSGRIRIWTYTFDSRDYAFNPCAMRQAEKAMATHSRTLAWSIPWTEEPGGLQSMGSHRVGHDWSDLAAAAMSQEEKAT